MSRFTQIFYAFACLNLGRNLLEVNAQQQCMYDGVQQCQPTPANSMPSNIIENRGFAQPQYGSYAEPSQVIRPDWPDMARQIQNGQFPRQQSPYYGHEQVPTTSPIQYSTSNPTNPPNPYQAATVQSFNNYYPQYRATRRSQGISQPTLAQQLKEHLRMKAIYARAANPFRSCEANQQFQAQPNLMTGINPQITNQDVYSQPLPNLYHQLLHVQSE